jgi:hypothetical protein
MNTGSHGSGSPHACSSVTSLGVAVQSSPPELPLVVVEPVEAESDAVAPVDASVEEEDDDPSDPSPPAEGPHASTTANAPQSPTLEAMRASYRGGAYNRETGCL